MQILNTITKCAAVVIAAISFSTVSFATPKVDLYQNMETIGQAYTIDLAKWQGPGTGVKFIIQRMARINGKCPAPLQPNSSNGCSGYQYEVSCVANISGMPSGQQEGFVIAQKFGVIAPIAFTNGNKVLLNNLTMGYSDPNNRTEDEAIKFYPMTPNKNGKITCVITKVSPSNHN